MAKQKKTQQYIYKINSSLLRLNKWDLELPLKTARDIPGMVVALADSQVLSWINELNGTEDFDEQAKAIRRQIKEIKQQKPSRENKLKISRLYEELYRIQFKSDYVCVIMDRKSDYDRANKGFSINGIQYKRLICTTNGVKTSTVVYCSERLHEELKKRIANGRNEKIPLVPAKLGAYESLVASASVEVSWPRSSTAPIPGGIIVVPDAFTEFKADLINIDDSDRSKEPVVEFAKDQDVRNNCSDGCGMMLPDVSARWCKELTGKDGYLAGVNWRTAWTKGMVFTFDFIDFAEKVAGASENNPRAYMIKDVWGDWRDVRDAGAIITESQLKLWSSYTSWEDYFYCCTDNHYTLRVAKTAPHDVDDVRQLNYQFIQSLDLSDGDVQDLIAPTVNEIKSVMGMDPDVTLAYLCGKNVNESNISSYAPASQALMLERKCIYDKNLRGMAQKMIRRRINDAKIGVLDVHGNFQIISGDLYALCESMFGMPVRGLLRAGEIYSKYWLDEKVDRVLCMRAPMSNKHSLVAQNISTSDDAQYWFRYITTCIVVNAWDCMAMALNG